MTPAASPSNNLTPVICVVGRKNSGKTTLLERLLPALSQKGLKMAYLKHDVHGFEMDREGTDTWRLGRAGAGVVTISSPDMVASLVRVERERSLEELRASIPNGYDLLLAEGFKSSDAPRIEVLREGELMCAESDLLAVVSALPGSAESVPLFHPEAIEELAGFIMEKAGLEQPSGEGAR